MMGYGTFSGYGYDCMANYGVGHLINIVLLVLFVLLIVSILRRRQNMRGLHGIWHGNTALDLLQERYVKGEIDRAEYEQKKKDLTS